MKYPSHYNTCLHLFFFCPKDTVSAYLPYSSHYSTCLPSWCVTSGRRSTVIGRISIDRWGSRKMRWKWSSVEKRVVRRKWGVSEGFIVWRYGQVIVKFILWCPNRVEKNSGKTFCKRDGCGGVWRKQIVKRRCWVGFHYIDKGRKW